MTYRELLKLYKDGKLDDKQQNEVAQEIEKQDAIGEYLFDEAGISQESCGNDGEIPQERSLPDEGADSEAFAGMIHKNIRKAFIKMGIIVGICILAIGLFVAFVLPQAVDAFYYDPSSSAYEGQSSGTDMNKLSLDMRVYSELYVPLKYMDSAYTESDGYGNYDFVLSQTAYPTYDEQPTVSGKISRNKITFYDKSYLKKPAGNAFEWTAQPLNISRTLTSLMKTKNAENMVGTRAESKAYIKGLPDGDHTAYITLNKVVSYRSACRLADKWDLGSWWCGIVTGNDEQKIIGMRGDIGSYDEQKAISGYPYLLGYKSVKDLSGGNSDKIDKEYRAHAQEHFISLLKYMKDQDKFSKMMDADDTGVDSGAAVRYINKNGLKVYGIVIRADRAELLKILDDNAVYVIS